MSKGKIILNRIKNPELLLLDLDRFGLLKMADKKCLELRYKTKFGYYPDLEHPKTFNEKIQWMKLYYRRSELPGLVDKAEAKKRVAKIIGDEYIIPTIGVYDSFDEIDFNKLPNQFVIKCTHDCASVIVCRDKRKFDIKNARKKIKKALSVEYHGKSAREWVYSQIKPRIIIEKFMENEGVDGITDYKFFCFNGEPRVMYVSDGSHTDDQRIAFFDMNYKYLQIKRSDYNDYEVLPPKPKSFENMKKLARKLSKDFPQVRVDLYEIGGKPYFGELTFYTCGGMVPWEKHEYDERLGRMIKLPRKEYDK